MSRIQFRLMLLLFCVFYLKKNFFAASENVFKMDKRKKQAIKKEREKFRKYTRINEKCKFL